MLSSLTTKLALRKMGISSDTFNFSNTFSSPEPTPTKKLTRKGTAPALDEEEENSSAWPAWMSVRKLPLTVQPWLSPPPPPVAIAAECPRVGDLAPLDRDRLLTFGGGKKVVVVFLRCVGCACEFDTPYPVSPANPSPINKHVIDMPDPSQSPKRLSSPSAPSPPSTPAP